MVRTAHYERKKETLYGEVAATIEMQILSGTYRRGDRLPSLRELSRRLGISINTAREAYGNLESRRIIRGVPQSGYYVNGDSEQLNIGSLDKPRIVENEFITNYNSMITEFLKTDLHPFCSAMFELTSLPYSKKLYLSREDQLKMDLFNYAPLSGLPELRVEIARRSIDSGMTVSADDIIITEGGMAGIALAIKHFTVPGDTVALESPFYYNFLFLLKEFGLKVIEIPMNPDTGMNLDVLEFVLDRQQVKAVITIATNSNPIGSTMPPEAKRRLVELCGTNSVLLLEDDIYGDIYFGEKRAPACKAFDESGNVILCSSFTKSLAPGLRLGWMVPGRHYEKILAVKTMTNVATSTLSQHMALNFLSGGHYDRHMRQLNKSAEQRVAALRQAVKKHFHPDTQVTEPKGGFVLWITLPGRGDMNNIYETAKSEGILFTPGNLFSLENRWDNCLRLSAGYYKPELEPQIEKLARIVDKLWSFSG